MRQANFVWLVIVATAACTTADHPVAPRDRSPASNRPALAIEGVRPIVRESVTAPEHRRNPFAFGGEGSPGPRTGALPPLPPPQGLPELPLPLPRPAIRLLGITTGRENPPVRTAVLSVGGDLVLAHVGETVGGRYRVDAIGDDAVELVDGAAQEHLRLPLS